MLQGLKKTNLHEQNILVLINYVVPLKHPSFTRGGGVGSGVGGGGGGGGGNSVSTESDKLLCFVAKAMPKLATLSQMIHAQEREEKGEAVGKGGGSYHVIIWPCGKLL